MMSSLSLGSTSGTPTANMMFFSPQPTSKTEVGLCIAGKFITEKELSDALFSSEVQGSLRCKMLEFSLIVNERKTPRAHKFFIKLDGELVSISPRCSYSSSPHC